MVSTLYGAVAVALGICSYLLVAVFGSALSIRLRSAIAQFYWGLATRSLGRLVIIRRTVGEHQIKKMHIDDEKSAFKVELNEGILGGGKPLHCNDPDDRVHRLNRKPLAFVHETVNAALDIQLAETGYWFRRHVDDGRLWLESGNLNPHFEVGDESRLANLDDALPLILSDVEPQEVETMEEYTRHRFAKYAGDLDAIDGIIAFTGMAIGFGFVVVGRYVQRKILGEGGSDPSTTIPVDSLGDVALAIQQPAQELLVTLL